MAWWRFRCFTVRMPGAEWHAMVAPAKAWALALLTVHDDSSARAMAESYAYDAAWAMASMVGEPPGWRQRNLAVALAYKVGGVAQAPGMRGVSSQ